MCLALAVERAHGGRSTPGWDVPTPKATAHSERICFLMLYVCNTLVGTEASIQQPHHVDRGFFIVNDVSF
jgi:hypothetical protein